MTHSSRALTLGTLLVGAFVQIGCVAWQGGSARKIDPFPTAAMQTEPPVSMAVDVNYRIFGMNPPPAALLKAATDLRGKALGVAARSRRFMVPGPQQPADFHLDLQIADQASPHIPLAILSGLTLTVLPAWASDDFDIVGTLQDRTGRVVATYHAQQGQTVLIQLLMVFGMPFASPGATGDRLWNQVFEDVFAFCDEHIGQGGSAPVALGSGRTPNPGPQ
jgi:hypothetical protein